MILVVSTRCHMFFSLIFVVAIEQPAGYGRNDAAMPPRDLVPEFQDASEKRTVSTSSLGDKGLVANVSSGEERHRMLRNFSTDRGELKE